MEEYYGNIHELASHAAKNRKDRDLRNQSDMYKLVLEYGRIGAVTDALEKVEKTLPRHLLRDAVRALCSTPESFVEVRQRFATSFAVLTMCCYVFGLGDRHLENFLIDTRSGMCIGIDFGAAFGYGITLPIPELMPFRMTRQFTHFMEPLNSLALYKQDMIQCLTALRNQRSIILTVMDVFIKEPHLDWVEQSQRRQSKAKGRGNSVSMGETSGSADGSSRQSELAWFPQQKIAIARRKLLGHNCASIMLSELEETPIHRDAALFKACKRLIRGLKDCPRSLRKWKVCESVTEQVECLLDHATDKNILGRTYHGWSSFL